MLDSLRSVFVDRLPITEGWQLLVLLAAGVVAVAIVHRYVRRQVALIDRARSSRDDDGSSTTG